jgi:hypothetical protein
VRDRGVEVAEPLRQLREVHGADGGVDAGDRDEEDDRRQQADHDVDRAGADPRLRAAERDEHVAGREQHLEPDEQVEQVGRQERVGHPGAQHEVRRVEHRQRRVAAVLDDALPEGVEQHGEGHHGRDEQHQR